METCTVNSFWGTLDQKFKNGSVVYQHLCFRLSLGKEILKLSETCAEFKGFSENKIWQWWHHGEVFSVVESQQEALGLEAAGECLRVCYRQVLPFPLPDQDTQVRLIVGVQESIETLKYCSTSWCSTVAVRKSAVSIITWSICDGGFVLSLGLWPLSCSWFLSNIYYYINMIYNTIKKCYIWIL